MNAYYSIILQLFDMVFLENMDKSYPGAKKLLRKECFAVARSLMPGANTLSLIFHFSR